MRIPERVALAPTPGGEQAYIAFLGELVNRPQWLEKLAAWSFLFGFSRPGPANNLHAAWYAIERQLAPLRLLVTNPEDTLRRLDPNGLRRFLLDAIVSVEPVLLGDPTQALATFARATRSRQLILHDPYAWTNRRQLAEFLNQANTPATCQPLTITLLMPLRQHEIGTGRERTEWRKRLREAQYLFARNNCVGITLQGYDDAARIADRHWSHSRWVIGENTGMWVDTGFFDAKHDQSLTAFPLPVPVQRAMKTWAEQLTRTYAQIRTTV